MSPNLARIFDGKKHLWDGRLYATREEASASEEAYLKDNFEVRVVDDEGKFLLYTRRLVKEVVATAH